MLARRSDSIRKTIEGNIAGGRTARDRGERAFAAATSRPGDVLGLHFFSPANIRKLPEIVRAAATAPDVIATALALARRIGKVAVVAGKAHGFIGTACSRSGGGRPRRWCWTRLAL